MLTAPHPANATLITSFGLCFHGCPRYAPAVNAGMQLTFRRNPGHPVDDDAVQILNPAGNQVGHIAHAHGCPDQSGVIGPMMDNPINNAIWINARIHPGGWVNIWHIPVIVEIWAPAHWSYNQCRRRSGHLVRKLNNQPGTFVNVINHTP